MMKMLILAGVASVSLAVVSQPVRAAGCVSGAAVGGVAGHLAGHHALLGAAAGCAVGHHEAKRQQRANAAAQNQAPPGQPAPSHN